MGSGTGSAAVKKSSVTKVASTGGAASKAKKAKPAADEEDEEDEDVANTNAPVATVCLRVYFLLLSPYCAQMCVYVCVCEFPVQLALLSVHSLGC